MDFSAFVGKLLEEQDGDVLREGIRVLAQALMETEVAGLIGAERYERSGERARYRNGYRLRTWDTRELNSDACVTGGGLTGRVWVFCGCSGRAGAIGTICSVAVAGAERDASRRSPVSSRSRVPMTLVAFEHRGGPRPASSRLNDGTRGIDVERTPRPERAAHVPAPEAGEVGELGSIGDVWGAASRSAVTFPCSGGALQRHPRETKGQEYDVTTEVAGNGCGPAGAKGGSCC
jgi:hypothetical protein